MAGIFGLIGAAAGLAGDKYVAKPLPGLDTATEVAKATGVNQANLPAAQQLASGVNLFNQQQLQAMLQRGIPGYQALQDQTSKTLLSMIRGEIPDANRIASRDAARAVGLGIPGSEGARNLTLRDLNISSLAATEAGLTAADRWMALTDRMAVPHEFDVTSQFITPAQQIAFDVNERNAQWNVENLRGQQKALPGPVEQEAMGIMNWLDDTGKALAGASIGSAMGGAGIGMGGGSSGGNPTTMTFGNQTPQTFAGSGIQFGSGFDQNGSMIAPF